MNISRAEHTVNIGISDAYYVDKLRHYYGICKSSFTNDINFIIDMHVVCYTVEARISCD